MHAAKRPILAPRFASANGVARLALTKKDQTFCRQFEAIARLVPALRGPIKALRSDRWIYLRIPLAHFLIAGGFV